jgi:hypothetical protein
MATMNEIYFEAMKEMAKGNNDYDYVFEAIMRMSEQVTDTHNEREMVDLGFNTHMLMRSYLAMKS